MFSTLDGLLIIPPIFLLVVAWRSSDAVQDLVVNRQKLTKRIVGAASPIAVRYTIWDTQIAGFGLRVTSSGIKTFLIRYRAKGRSAKRYVTLGRYGIVTVQEAREHERRILGAVVNGNDPAHEVATCRLVSTLAVVATDFLADHVALKRKPKTLSSYTTPLNVTSFRNSGSEGCPN
jgi:hypothetical protein